jgi:hypothetical protein
MKYDIVENAPPPPIAKSGGENTYTPVYERLSKLKAVGEYVAITLDIEGLTAKGIYDKRNAVVCSVKDWFRRRKLLHDFAGFRSLRTASLASEDKKNMTVWFILEA